MATFYVDPSGGNDSNNGTSFALRKKTTSSLSPSAGDTVRIMKSPDPTDMGQTASWTSQSVTVTLTTAVNSTVFNCDSAWTGFGTGFSSSTSSTAKEGTGNSGCSIATGYTTSAVGMYFTLGASTDFSAYQQISFWIIPSATIAGSTITVKLCSDTLGATAVNTMTITNKLTGGNFNCITLNNGSALGSNIQSIGVYFSSGIANGTTVRFDNIIACKATSSADSLTLNSVIGQNDGIWYGIKSISGTTIKLDVDANTTSAGRGWHNSTGSAEIWKRECFLSPDTTVAPLGIPANSGSSGSPITYSGGWDTTNMSTQSGDSWFDGSAGTIEVCTTSATAVSWITVDHCSAVRGLSGFKPNNSNWVISNASVVCCGTATGINTSSMGGNPLTMTNITIVQGSAACITSTGASSVIILTGTLSMYSCQTTAWLMGNGTAIVDARGVTITSSNHATHGLELNGKTSRLGNITTNKNSSSGLFINSGYYYELTSLTANSNTNGLGLNVGIPGMKIFSLTTGSNTNGINFLVGQGIATLVVNNWVSTSDTNRTANTSNLATYNDFRLQSHEQDGTAGNNVITTDGGTIKSQTTTRHTASGTAWQLSPTSTTRSR